MLHYDQQLIANYLSEPAESGDNSQCISHLSERFWLQFIKKWGYYYSLHCQTTLALGINRAALSIDLVPRILG